MNSDMTHRSLRMDKQKVHEPMHTSIHCQHAINSAARSVFIESGITWSNVSCHSLPVVRAAPSNVVLVSALVTFGAVLEISDTLFEMFIANGLRGVLVTAVAGVLAVLVTHVAGNAFDIVIPIEHKELGVIECGWLPLIVTMALTAFAGQPLVKSVSRWHVTTTTLGASLLIEQGMFEVHWRPYPTRTGMVGVTAHAIGAFQLFVKG